MRITERLLEVGGSNVLRLRGVSPWHKADTTQQRPSLTDKKPLDEIKHLIAKREHAYKSAADYTINTSYVSCEDIVNEIITMANKTTNK